MGGIDPDALPELAARSVPAPPEPIAAPEGARPAVLAADVSTPLEQLPLPRNDV